MSCPDDPGSINGKYYHIRQEKTITQSSIIIIVGGPSLETRKFPPFFPILISGLVLGALGWGGLAYVVFLNDPELGYRWLFFFCVMLAVGGTSLPIVGFLNRRFPTTPEAGEGVILRQAVLVGLYSSLLVWLQQGRILTNTVAFFLAVGFVLVEVFLRMGERARWHPPKEELEHD
jgi:hypothetical protein